MAIGAVPLTVGLSIQTSTLRVPELDTAGLGHLLQNSLIVQMKALQNTMKEYPPDTARMVRSQGTREGRFTMTTRGRGGRMVQVPATEEGYIRSGNLGASWHLVDTPYYVRLYNDAREHGFTLARSGKQKRGKGRPYAVFVHGNGDGSLGQAHQFQGSGWKNLFVESQKMRVEFQRLTEGIMASWASSGMDSLAAAQSFSKAPAGNR